MLDQKFNEFIKVVKRLRKECPWDREQTNDSIKANTLEEAYEVVNAIDDKNDDEFKKELGDLLLHVFFHANIAEEENRFKMEEVLDAITEKLIRRHPHVFAKQENTNSEEVKVNWESHKLKEGRKSILDGLPKSMPALLRAFRVQEKASKFGFDWDNKADVWEKVVEEIDELREAESQKNQVHIEKELGDLLFSITNYSRFLDINPENALRNATKKFEKRFQFIEKKLKEKNSSVSDATFQEMDALWDESKKTIK